MAKSKHDQIAERFAEQENVEYNRGKGPDVKGKDRTLEIAVSSSDVQSSVKQVRRYRKPYIVTTPELVEKALDVTKGTGVGVMKLNGQIVKKPRKS